MPANPDPKGDQPDSLLVITSRDKHEKHGESLLEVSRPTCLETIYLAVGEGCLGMAVLSLRGPSFLLRAPFCGLVKFSSAVAV